MLVWIREPRPPPTSTAGVFCGYELRNPCPHSATRTSTMKAILCTHYGGPDELELADIPAPTAGPNEAVVRIKAAALNFFDTLMIAGKYQYKPPFPFSPASEFAGVV